MKIRPVGAELFHTDGRTVMTNHRGRVKSNTSLFFKNVSVFSQATVTLVIYSFQGNYTICNNRPFVSNEISFSSIKFHFHF